MDRIGTDQELAERHIKPAAGLLATRLLNSQEPELAAAIAAATASGCSPEAIRVVVLKLLRRQDTAALAKLYAEQINGIESAE